MNCKASSSSSNAHNAAGQQKEKIKRQLWPGRAIDKQRKGVGGRGSKGGSERWSMDGSKLRQ